MLRLLATLAVVRAQTAIVKYCDDPAALNYDASARAPPSSLPPSPPPRALCESWSSVFASAPTAM